MATQGQPKPQWSPGVITWETSAKTLRLERSAAAPQWSPGVITWETRLPGEVFRRGQASMEPRCNHLGNASARESQSRWKWPQWSPGVITRETAP